MAGNHRAVSDRRRWRRRSARTVVPAPRARGIEVVEAVTKRAHQVSPEKSWPVRGVLM
jgi:hypothetical protein